MPPAAGRTSGRNSRPVGSGRLEAASPTPYSGPSNVVPDYNTHAPQPVRGGGDCSALESNTKCGVGRAVLIPTAPNPGTFSHRGGGTWRL